MQPKWRTSEISKREVGGSWDELQKPGINGLLSVMAGLFYWGKSVRHGGDDDDEGRSKWDELLMDIAWVLQQLTDEKTPSSDA